MDKLKIYLDNCSLNRPFDDLSNDKVRLESEAVLTIINTCELGEWHLYCSDVLYDEIDCMTNPLRKEKVLTLYKTSYHCVEINSQIVLRAKEFEKYNIKAYDALHLASAEYGNVDVFLTTDKKLLNRALKSNVGICVSNPAIWLMEVLYNDW